MRLPSLYSPHYPRLLQMGVPIMVGQLSTIVIGFADTLMIGGYGTRELAAVGFVNAIIGLMIISSMGFSYGLTPVVGALMGEGRAEEVAQKLKNSLVANLLVATVMVLFLVVLLLVLEHLQMPVELVPLMRPYLAILTFSLPLQMAFNAFKQFSDGIQETRIPMWILLGGNALNVLGNWLLIYGVGGMPEWGLFGAGVATFVSRAAMIGAFWWVFRYSPRYRLYRCKWHTAIINRHDLCILSRLGWPLLLQFGMESASFSLSAFYVGWLGVASLAAHQVMITVSSLCFMLYYGMAAAVAVQVSYYRGAGNLVEARRSALAGLHLTWGLCFLTALPIFLLRNKIGYLFTTDDEVATAVATLIIPFCLYQLGDALQCIYSNALRGMEDVKPLAWIAFLAYFVVSLPLGYLFAFRLQWGLPGVWLAFPFGLTCAGVMYLTRFRQTIVRREKQHTPSLTIHNL